VNRSKLKGDRAERELVAQLIGLSGWPIERRLQQGRTDDSGDLLGLPDCCAQVKDYADPLRAEREALAALDEQRACARTTYAAAFVRHRGGRWVVALTPAMFVELLRAATKTA
jgi:hypothetical protein